MQKVPFLQGSFSEQDHAVKLWVQSTCNTKQADAIEGSKCKVKALPFLSMEWGSDCFFPISAKDLTIGILLLSFFWFWW